MVRVSQEPEPAPRRRRRHVPNTSQAWLWDPATGATKRVDPPLWRDPADGLLKPANIWCAGQSFLADGRLLVTGGNLATRTARLDLEGPQQGLHLQPLQRDLDRAARHAPRALVSEPGPACPTAARDHERAATRPAASSTRNTDVELFTPSADLNGRGTLTLLGHARRRRPAAAGRRTTRTCSRCRAGAPWWPARSRRQLVRQLARARRTRTAGRTSPNLPTDRLWGTAVLMPGGPGGSTRGDADGRLRPPRPHRAAYDRDLRRGQPRPRLAGGAVAQIGRGHHNTVLLPDGSMVTRRRRRRARGRRPVGRPTPSSGRSSCGTRRPRPGGSGPSRPRPAPTTRPRCCCPTDA